jgi:hypothetical protein
MAALVLWCQRQLRQDPDRPAAAQYRIGPLEQCIRPGPEARVQLPAEAPQQARCLFCIAPAAILSPSNGSWNDAPDSPSAASAVSAITRAISAASAHGCMGPYFL